MTICRDAASLSSDPTVLVLLCAIGLGCNLGTEVRGAAARVIVTPPSATVDADQVADFVAVGVSPSGDSADVAVTWAAAGGTVTDTSTTGFRHYARFRAGDLTGIYRVIATAHPGDGKDTALVTVTNGLVGSYYVAPTGNDGNPGTAAAPFRTIQKAADLVNPGDVVIVEDGIYTDTDGNGSVVAVDRGGTAGALVTFRARNKWMAKLDGQNGTAAQGFDLNNGIGYVRIEGFEIYGVANVGSASTGRGSASGIDLYDGGHDSQIVGNHIHDIGRVCTLSTNTNGQVAVYVQVPNVTIEQNLIHDIGRFFPGENGCSYSGFTGYQTLDHGVYLNGGSPGADGVMIRNNIFYNTRHGWAVQMYPGSLSNMQVLNNTFAFGNPNKNYTHIVLDASITGSTIANNIFYNPEGGRTMEAGGFSGSLTVSNNITLGSAMTDVGTPSGMTLVNNRLATNPLLVNPSAADFHPQATSPAINAGLVLPQVTVDFDGRLRPFAGNYEIGAYEY